MIVFLGTVFWVNGFSGFMTWTVCILFLFACGIFNKKSHVGLSRVPLKVLWCFSVHVLRYFLCFVFEIWAIACCDEDHFWSCLQKFCVLPLLGCPYFSSRDFFFFAMFSLNRSSNPFCLSPKFRNSNNIDALSFDSISMEPFPKTDVLR